LTNGNYVVDSPSWNGQRGAVTWGNGNREMIGNVSAANSLVGSDSGDGEFTFVAPLSNGNYVVSSSNWSSRRGAVTWGNGGMGISGTISAANSLVGTNPADVVGRDIMPLPNGNFLVESPSWNGSRGAVTWGDGSRGVSGTISAANSLVGDSPGDDVGAFDDSFQSIILLTNGNYVIDSPYWNSKRGAVTWGNASSGVSGSISAANSLVGSSAGELIGGYYELVGGDRFHFPYVGVIKNVIPLQDGNYVVASPLWNGERGAVTWGNGTTGLTGTISEGNSVIGSNPEDAIGTFGGGYYQGAYLTSPSITVLSNGNYLIETGKLQEVTWVSGTSGQTWDGRANLTPQNSLPGHLIFAGPGSIPHTLIENSIEHTFFVAPPTPGRITAGFADPAQPTYGITASQSFTVTSAFLTRTLNTGTAMVLQASNDITVNSPITVSGSGHGGALTLQAGRSLVLNASITTDNGDLTLIANDQQANGVVDAERDPGQAAITMAPGTSLDTGSGALTVELRDGAGLNHPDSGAITMQTVAAGSVSVVNRGPSPGSDVQLGAVTTTGSQFYANPNGITTVAGNLSTAGSAISFTDSVIVNGGMSVTAGTNAVYFAGAGTQTLQAGSGSRFGNVNHTARGTLRLASDLTVLGSFNNGVGTFDANDHAVSGTGAAAILGGTYRAGTAPQTFSSGLAILNGMLISSTGPMNITGGVRLLGGSLSGVGAVDAITGVEGTVAPGDNHAGILRVRSTVTLNPATTFRTLLSGSEAGTGYAQLQAGGPVDLGGSTLSLALGFAPPVGSSFEILTNTGSAPIRGTFGGLEEGTVFAQSGYQFQITYRGGTHGNSVVLTRLA